MKVCVILTLAKTMLCALKIEKAFVVIIVSVIRLRLLVCNHYITISVFTIFRNLFITFLGEYCEHELKESCPVSWWGHHRGVCGPCNCMVDNGYNPHCNKTTGQCYCKVKLI